MHHDSERVNALTIGCGLLFYLRDAGVWRYLRIANRELPALFFIPKLQCIMYKLPLIALFITIISGSCIERTNQSSHNTQSNSSINSINQERLLEKAEKRGFERGKIEHALYDRWSEFGNKEYYTYIKTLNSGMKLYRIDTPEILMEVYVLNDIISIQSSSLMTGEETDEIFSEMDAWLKSCNPISSKRKNEKDKNGNSIVTIEYKFPEYKAVLVNRGTAIQYMLSINDEPDTYYYVDRQPATEQNSDKLEKQFTNKYFSLRYPSSWQIVQEENKVTQNTAISLQIMEIRKNEDDFLTNINIIVSSKKSEMPTSELAKIASGDLKKCWNSYGHIYIKNNIELGNAKGSVLEYTFSIDGFSLVGEQYILKSADNTVYIITATSDKKTRAKKSKTIQSILNSLIIK